MSASFRVHGTFVLGTRALFIVRGVVAVGAVRAGQRVVHPAGIDAPVTGVEFALLSASGGADQTALTFRYASPAQLARWQALTTTGTELTLDDPTAPPLAPAGARSARR